MCCVGLIVVCFAAFFCIGYDNMVGDHNEPVLTDIIMWLMYVLVIATAALTVWSLVRGMQNSKGNDPEVSVVGMFEKLQRIQYGWNVGTETDNRKDKRRKGVQV